MPALRQCKKCRRSLPATCEHFQPMKVKMKNGDVWHGLSAECRDCRRERFREFYRENQQAMVERAVIYKQKRRRDPVYREKERAYDRQLKRELFGFSPRILP